MEAKQNCSNNLTLEDFNKADLKLQGDEAIHFGEYFDTIHGIVLYYYNGYLVETYYNIDSNVIEEMKAISISDAAVKFVPLAEFFA